MSMPYAEGCVARPWEGSGYPQKTICNSQVGGVVLTRKEKEECFT
jgi:hypothetical protein